MKRIYIPLPDDASRRQLFKNLLTNIAHSVREDDVDTLVRLTDEYSGDPSAQRLPWGNKKLELRLMIIILMMMMMMTMTMIGIKRPARELAASCHNRSLNSMSTKFPQYPWIHGALPGSGAAHGLSEQFKGFID